MSVLTEKLSVTNLQNFFNDISGNTNSYYMFLGKTTPWANDSSPPQPSNDYQDFEQTIYDDIVFGKQISNSNISFLIPRNTWANNTPYAQYDATDPNMFTKSFFVVNQSMDVFKVIDNAGGANSTIQPSLRSTTGTFQTSDGYTWKYMYSVPSAANTTFTTNNVIPVVANTIVANNAVPGTIDVTRVIVPGLNYQYTEGFIRNVISTSAVQVSNASLVDDIYNGSSIYLRAGLGAAQIRQIVDYAGGTQVVTVNPPFDTFVTLSISGITGSFLLGQNVIQNIADISYIFPQGFFNPGDSLIQVDNLALGTVETSNSTVIGVNQTSANNFQVLGGAYPIVDQSQASTLRTGLLSVTSGSNVITGGTANLLTYSVNNYIQVGANANLNVRRITSITNSSLATVSIPFNATLAANTHSIVPYAFEPSSITVVSSNGIIKQVNLDSLVLNYGNVSSNTISFIPGETVKEVNSLGVDQASNGIIAFVNSSAVILSQINGAMVDGLFLVGQSSSLKAQIQQIASYPNITLANSLGTFTTGDQVSSFYSNGIISGNASVLSFSYTPSGVTEFIISPTVNFAGDGNGASAYAIVNNAIGNNSPIEKIVMINNGMNYTFSNTTITANSVQGSGAVVEAVISPISGHGANAYVELGASLGGISVTFDTAANELFAFPGYGSYRKAGIIKNPLFNSLYVNTDNVHRTSVSIQSLNSNTFTVGEIVYQYTSSAAGKVLFANTTQVILDSVNGTLTSNALVSGNNLIIGLKSGATANVVTANAVQFSLSSNSQIVSEANVVVGDIIQVVSNNQLLLTNVAGKIALGNIYDPVSNTTANALSFFVANGTVNATATFGKKFNQTTRLTLTTASATPFQVGEAVNQTISGASGLVLDTTHELDVVYVQNNGTITIGTTLTDSNTSATAVVTFANTTYLRLTGVAGSFRAGDVISTISANGNISGIFPVLTVSNIMGTFQIQQSGGAAAPVIIGNTSGAQGSMQLANTIVYPDLVRNTGDVLYINNLSPVTLGANTKETFNLTVQI